MKACNLVFPHQLTYPFELNRELPTFLIEEHLFFSQYAFHRQKLVFHRATCKAYFDYLKKQNIEVYYIDSTASLSDIRNWSQEGTFLEFSQFNLLDPADHYLERRLQQSARQWGGEIVIHISPLFILDTPDIQRHFQATKKKYNHAPFYQSQREQLGILLSSDGGPLGGKWSFDTENRKKYPRGQKPPLRSFPIFNSYVEEAITYVERYFPKALGLPPKTVFYPTTREESITWLHDFLDQHLDIFGPYEDAMVKGENWLHHSILSPLINTGLLSPREVLACAEDRFKNKELSLSSTEGFVRQIIGWREYIRGIYTIRGVEQRTTNFWGFTRDMPLSLYDGTTGIVPVDDVIQRVLKTGYCHHIERLMVLGNFMLLCEIKPNAVYKWFMELFIDAYDWVMVPNVYGMSQYADGGLLANKPYISGSNYILKMSDFPKGEWTKIWDALFWRFLSVHSSTFGKQPRWAMLLSTWHKKSPEMRMELLDTAEQFLKNLHGE